MREVSALIFGYNEYTYEILKNIKNKYENIHIFKHKDESSLEILEAFDFEEFDFSYDWVQLALNYNIKKSVAFCVLEDEAKNIFLTISLRSIFKDLTIIALSNNKESANKLNMAGANKVIPVVQTTASIILDTLQKPIVTEVLENVLYKDHSLKIAQINIMDNSCFEGQYPSEIQWNKKYGIIVLSIEHPDMSSEFIYSSKAKHHPIQKGDIFVVMGYEQDIKDFKKIIGDDGCQLEL